MGQIDIPGNLSGTTYRFTIAGDQPTREEFARMQSVISDGESRFRQEFEASSGLGLAVDDQPGTAIGRGVRRGIPQFQSALGTAAEYAGLEGIGDYLQTAATERQLDMLEENPALLEGADFRDVRGLGSALTYAGELLGEQAPLIGGTIGVGAATGGAGALAGLGTGAATLLGTTAGTLAVSGPQLFGSNLQRQEAQVVAGELASVDVGDAATAAIAQSGLELLSNLVLVGRIPASLGRAILQNATVEGLTEVGQQAMERQQAGLPLDSEDAVREYLDAGVAGATLGGVFGGVGYGVDRLTRRPEEETTPDQLALTGPEARLALPAPDRLALPAPARGLPAPTPGLPAPPRGLPRPTTGAAPRGLPGPDTIPPSPESPRRAGPGTAPIRVPPQPGQVRDAELNVPQLSPDAAATAQSIGSDPQMLAAVEAIQSEGKATIPVIQNALGLSYNAARGVMMKLENVGAVSKAQGGRPRTLTLPFQITAVQGGGPGEVTITPTEDATPAGSRTPPAEASAAGDLPAAKPKRPRTRAGRGVPDAARAAAAVGEEPAGPPEETAPEPVERPVDDAERATGGAGEQQPALTPEQIADLQRRQRSGEDVSAEIAALQQEARARRPESEYEPRSGQLPGQVTAAAGQVIPSPGITPSVGRTTTAQQARMADEINQQQTRTAQRNRLQDRIAELRGTLNSQAKLRTLAKESGTKPAETAQRLRKQLAGLLAEQVATEQRIREARRSGVAFREATAQERSVIEAQLEGEYQAAREEFANVVYEQMSPALRSDSREYSGAREMGYTDPLVPGDLSERIAPLLRMSRDALRATSGATAAYEYFRKAMDPLDALVQIAYDVDPITVKSRKSTAEEPLTPYFEGTGRDNARKARKWVGENLNPDVADFIDSVAAEASSEAMNAAAQRVNAVGLRRELQALASKRQLGDITEAQYQERRAELNQDYKARFGFDESALQALFSPLKRPTGKLRAMMAGLGPMMPMHSTVRAALQNNNLDAALRALAATAKTGINRKLAAQLRPYTGDTQVEFVSNGDPRIPTGAVGVFDPRINTILLNEDAPFTEHTLLHEMAHVATEAELRNPASPVRARLETIRKEIAAKYPEEYGATDVFEFTAEAFTNPEFQSKMAQVQLAKGQPSVLTRFKQAFANFVRRLLGRPAKRYEPDAIGVEVNEEVDALVNSILAVAPDMRSAEPAFEIATRPLMARAYMSKPAQRAADLSAETYDGMLNWWSRAEVPQRTRKFVNDAFIPLRNLVGYAKPYLPMAEKAWDIVTGHHQAIRGRNDVLRATVDMISKKVPKDKVHIFNNLRLEASLYGINVFLPLKAYSDFRLVYRKVAKDGTPGPRQYEYFKNKTERDARVAELNKDRPASRTRALARDPDTEKAAKHRELKRIYEREFTPEMRDAYKQTLGYFQYLHGEAARVFKARLEAMLPGQQRLQRVVYDRLFDKLFNENSLVAYQPLQRTGRYWVAHSARDPVTKQVEQYKLSFETQRERQQYVKQLNALPKSAGITGVEMYTKLQDFFEPNRPPAAFVAEVGRILDRNATAAGVQARKEAQDTGASEAEADAAAANAEALARRIAGDTQQSVVELALTMMPERSFLQAYKERSGVRGFAGDVGPVNNELSKADTINMLLRKGASLSRQLADMEFGARAQALRGEMKDHREAQIAKGISPERLEKLDTYYNSISEAMKNIYVDRHPMVRAFNTGSYMMTLGFNPSSAIMTFMAVPTIIGPYLAGRYGAARTAQAFNHAMKVLGGSGRTRTVEAIVDEYGNTRKRRVPMGVAGVSLENYDLGGYNPAESYISDSNKLSRYGTLQALARERGLFADSIQYDMLDAENLTGHGLHQRFIHAGAWMMHTSERMVRESTLLAAYDLALQDMAGGKAKRADGTTSKNTRLTEADLQKAAEIAVSDTELTNGTIAAAGSPNLSQHGIMPLLYMFKRYPLAMYNLLATLMKQSFPSEKQLAELYGKGSPEYKAGLEGRAAARWQLGLVVGNVGLWAGAAGLPLYGALSGMIDKVFRDDDEPDVDTLLRMSIGELGFKGLGNYLLGAEMSSRIGLANMFYRAPIGREDQSWMWNLIEGAGGPAISIAANAWPRAIGLWNDGEYWRATETALPAQVRNFLRTARYAQSGAIESTRGDVITEVNNGQLLGQLLGLSPADYIQQIEVNSVLKGIDESIRAQRTRLLRRLNVARREGNAVEYSRVMQEILEFTQEHPQFAIGGDTVQRSARTFSDTTQRVRRGIVYNSENERLLDRLAEQIESPSSLFQALGE